MNLKLRTAAVTTVEQYRLIGVAEMHTPLSSASRSGVPFGRRGTVGIDPALATCANSAVFPPLSQMNQ